MNNGQMHILLADDDEDDRLFFREAFDEIKINTKVETVNDGVELMDYLTRPDITLPHILFLDLNMPRKNGMDCLRELKRIDYLKDIAVVIYSTSASDVDIEETFVQGANVYLKKPNDFNTLRKTLEAVITTNWQYQTSGLNRDNFILSL
ncbi:MAG: response regulator [Prolixibacteraceae bacterium]|jgi:CheY-like chemotaxis protein|nr:response regulator [Prolixibacteraceae bacterium]